MCLLGSIDPHIPEVRYFKILPLKFKVKVTPFCSMSIGQPISEIWLFQTLTLKIQGQGNEWGQTALRSQGASGILSTHISLIPCQSSLPFQIYLPISKFDFEHQSKGHSSRSYSDSSILSTFILLVPYQSTLHSWDMAISKFDLENQRSRSWVRWKFLVT